jgi:small subunit ribosomal protein S17
MTDENVNEETQDQAADEPQVEATDAPDGVADAENLPVEQVPEGDVPGSAELEASAEPESTEEPAEGPPAEEPAEAPAEEPAAEAETTEEPAEEPPAEEQAADEPATELETAEPEASADEAEPASQPAEPDPAERPVAEAKRKRKRLPRALRPQRTRPKRERPTERKPIARLPKPEHERGRRQERQGTVVSAAADKTIVVRVDVVKVHPMYKKVVKRSTKLHAHDESNEAKIGDIVRLVETRPLSKQKRWRLHEIVEAAK